RSIRNPLRPRRPLRRSRILSRQPNRILSHPRRASNRRRRHLLAAKGRGPDPQGRRRPPAQRASARPRPRPQSSCLMHRRSERLLGFQLRNPDSSSHHHFLGFFFPIIVVAWRKSFLADSLSWRPLRATVACASRIVVTTSFRAGFVRTAAAAPASVAIVRMIVSAFSSAPASCVCTALCMSTVASAELNSVRGYGLVSAFHSLESSVNVTSTSCTSSTNENRSSVAFPAGLANLLHQRLVVVDPDADRGNRDAGFSHVLREAHELPAIGLADGGIAVRQEDDPVHGTGFLRPPARLLERGVQSIVHRGEAAD